MIINKKLIVPLAIFCCLLWSTAFVGVKIGYKYIDNPYMFAGLRFFFSGLILIPFFWPRNWVEEIKNNIGIIFNITILRTVIGYAIYYYALKIVEGALAAIIIGAGPIITAIMTHFMCKDDKLSKEKIITLLIGFCGIIIIILDKKPMTAIGVISLFGFILLIINSCLGVLANIKIAQYKGSCSPVFLSSCQLFFGGFILIFIGLFTGGKFPTNLSTEFYLSLGWLILVSSVAFSIWFILLQQPSVKVSKLNMWKFIIPTFGATFSWILLPNENPTLVTISGMILVLISLYKTNRSK